MRDDIKQMRTQDGVDASTAQDAAAAPEAENTNDKIPRLCR